MNYAEKVAAFEMSCHLYRTEIKEVEELKGKKLDPLTMRRVQIYEDDIRYVEGMFEMIRDLCGHHAAFLLWMLMVEELKRDEIAERYDLSRTTLSTWFEKWRHQIFDGD